MIYYDKLQKWKQINNSQTSIIPMESQILCSESTIEVLNNISKDTSGTKNAGFLIGSVTIYL